MTETTTRGRIGYQAYAEHTGGKTYDGRDMPAWADLGERIQGAWEAAAAAMVDVLSAGFDTPPGHGVFIDVRGGVVTLTHTVAGGVPVYVNGSYQMVPSRERTVFTIGDEPMPSPTTFGDALVLLRQGVRVTRTGWNGRGMWVAYQPGYPNGVPANANTARAFGIPEGAIVVMREYLVMRTADGQYVPWTPTVSDVLAADWIGA